MTIINTELYCLDYLLYKNKQSLPDYFTETHPHKYILFFCFHVPPPSLTTKSSSIKTLDHAPLGELIWFVIKTLYLSSNFHKRCSGIVLQHTKKFSIFPQDGSTKQ